jgi:hypothetical protein
MRRSTTGREAPSPCEEEDPKPEENYDDEEAELEGNPRA